MRDPHAERGRRRGSKRPSFGVFFRWHALCPMSIKAWSSSGDRGADRALDDSPVVMGPIVYLSAGSRAVSTLICRCMPAQAKKLVSTSTYDLQPFFSVAANPLLTQA